MNRPTALFFAVVVLLATMHRLPAPISEESTPTPAPEQSAKQKPKRARETKANRTTQASTATTTPTPAASKRFAGTWTGIMAEVPWGNVAVVDPAETTIEWWGAGTNHGTAKAQITGNTLHARFPAGFTTATWSITLQSDGTIAQVRLQAFMNDETAVFRRTSR
jgi:hypothetical protein